MTFVFRNNTIEQFLGAGYLFSGYDDINVPQADEYLWWYQLPIYFDTARLVAEVKMFVQKLEYVIEQIGDKTIYVFTLDAIGARPIEVADTEIYFAIAAFNERVYQYSKNANVKIVNISDFLSRFEKSDILDNRYYLTAQIPYNPQLIRPFQNWWKRRKEEIAMQRKKCLVLDLDNTLWGGVVGEDGIEGILLSGSYPGKAFHLWQEGLKMLQKSGVMFAICSKNNQSDVEEVWAKRDDMLLQKEDFVAMRINWQDKATNIRELAKELNIGLDAMVFVDDNPTERELIRQQLPMVVVPDFPDQPYDLLNLYRDLVYHYFGTYKLTNEDKQKTAQYIANRQRTQAQNSFSNMADYLRSLEMKLHIAQVSDVTLPRVAQLTQKTNQFNLTTHRYTEDDIKQLLADGAKIWTLSVKDKFGDYGLTGVLIIRDEKIDTLLMSCRILGKGIEKAFVLSVLKQYSKNVHAEYIPTVKNSQVADFYDKLGFEMVTGKQDGSKQYLCHIAKINRNVESYYEIKLK